LTIKLNFNLFDFCTEMAFLCTTMPEKKPFIFGLFLNHFLKHSKFNMYIDVFVSFNQLCLTIINKRKYCRYVMYMYITFHICNYVGVDRLVFFTMICVVPLLFISILCTICT